MRKDLSTERVWEAFSERLERFIRARTPDEHAASDILQETFARVHEKLAALQDDERIGPWVFRIAKNKIADHFRAQGRDAGALESDPALPSEAADADQIGEEVARWLPSMIDALPERYQDPLRMFELEERSQREIAERLGLSLTNVKSRVRRGRALLKESLHACCSFELDSRGNVLGYAPRAAGEGAGCDACRPHDTGGA